MRIACAANSAGRLPGPALGARIAWAVIPDEWVCGALEIKHLSDGAASCLHVRHSLELLEVIARLEQSGAGSRDQLAQVVGKLLEILEQRERTRRNGKAIAQPVRHRTSRQLDSLELAALALGRLIVHYVPHEGNPCDSLRAMATKNGADGSKISSRRLTM
jgi:hypothetical protein